MRKAPGIHRKFRRWAIVAVSVLALSLVLGLTDFCLVCFGHSPILSKTVTLFRDGGTTVQVGFGYRLVCWNRLDGEVGPEIWFWFLPFTVSGTTQRKGMHWIWADDAFQPFKQRSL